MTMELSRSFTFEAAHRLPHVPPDHKCARLHGHSFRVTVTVRGEVDPRLGWLIDFAALDDAWAPLHRVLDHHYLNEVPGLENPTSEHIAMYVGHQMRIPAGARLHSVTVHETCKASCTWFAPTEGAKVPVELRNQLDTKPSR